MCHFTYSFNIWIKKKKKKEKKRKKKKKTPQFHSKCYFRPSCIPIQPLQFQGTICPYLSINARSFYTPLVENEVLPLYVTLNKPLSLNNLISSPSSPSEHLIPSVRVFVMLMFGQFLNNLSISLDKPTDICWNILLTKMKKFCSEQL